MSKSIIDEVKQEVKQKKKEANAMKNNQTKETVKTIIITALISAIAAFAYGVHYQKQVMTDLHQKTEAVVSAATQVSKK